MENIVISKKELLLSSENNYYDVILNDLIYTMYDIKGITLDLPNECECVEIYIGETLIIRVDHNSLSKLSEFPIYLSMLSYQYVKLRIKYNKEWLKQNQKYSDILIYIENIELGENVEIFADDTYYVGKVVTRKKIPTTEFQIYGFKVITPEINLKIEENKNNYDTVEYPIDNNILIYYGGTAGFKYSS